MQKNIQILGWACMLLGAAASILFFTPGIHPKFVMLLTTLGFISSSIYTMLRTRLNPNGAIIHPGLIGMLLSSVPLIFMLYIRFSH